MNFLRNADNKIIIAGLGTLAVLGSFVAAAIFYAILSGLGMNEELSWALTMLVWILVVVISILGLVSFYNNSIKNRAEQVTVNNTVERVTIIREVVGPPQETPEITAAEVDPPPFLDEPPHPATSSVSYRSMLVEGEKVEPETQPFPAESEPSNTSPPSYRSTLLEGEQGEDEHR